ncbi:Uncharacterised protein [Photobacterium damselae]|uniref:Uncharacterized protein n=1 Tax=Photobacterium damselae TaxID=38293 RepID=A0A2X1X1L4_PHODM|nr:Uncharacterised protein [Photobacterium damselae]
MFSTIINTLGLCILGGKYILILILTALTVFSGSFNPEIAVLQLAENN